MSAQNPLRRKLKLQDLSGPQRLLVAGWRENDGEEACLQRIQSELGIEVSRATLYRVLGQWRDEAELAEHEATARRKVEMEAILQAKELTVEELEEAVDRQFLKQAAEQGDLKSYVQLRRLRIARQAAKERHQIAEAKLEIQRGRLALQREIVDRADSERVLKVAKDPKMREVLGLGISNAEKIALIRKAFFADIDEEVVDLPPMPPYPGEENRPSVKKTEGGEAAAVSADGSQSGNPEVTPSDSGVPSPQTGSPEVAAQGSSKAGVSHYAQTSVFPEAPWTPPQISGRQVPAPSPDPSTLEAGKRSHQSHPSHGSHFTRKDWVW